MTLKHLSVSLALRIALCLSVTLGIGLCALRPAMAADPVLKPLSAEDAAIYQKMVDKAIEFLRKNRAEDGTYSKQVGIGITALVTAGILQQGKSPDDPLVAQSLKFITDNVQPDGGIYVKDSKIANYDTSLSIMALVAGNKDGRYDKIIKGADAYIKALQWGETQGKGKDDPAYGGAGYGSKGRPDLSNTAFMIDALKAAGNGPDSEAVKRALVFINRCQNLESEHNTLPFAAKNPDGGFYYTPAAGGESQADKLSNGGLRSYGSMTYAGLKSMIYAGVKKDDPRVKAAVAWLAKNYDMKSNPGMGDSGLYYYYNTIAKALAAYGEETFKDDKGVEHNWRSELLKELASKQGTDGSWTNTNKRWMESDPNLSTGFVLLALSSLRGPAAK